MTGKVKEFKHDTMKIVVVARLLKLRCSRMWGQIDVYFVPGALADMSESLLFGNSWLWNTSNWVARFHKCSPLAHINLQVVIADPPAATSCLGTPGDITIKSIQQKAIQTNGLDLETK